MDWSKLDPNAVLAAFTVVGTGLAWLWAKATGKKTQTREELVDGALAEIVEVLVDHPQALFVARAKLETAAWAALARLGAKRARALEKLVTFAVERAMRVLVRRLNEAARARIPSQLNQLKQQLENVRDAFEVPPVDKRTVKPFGEGHFVRVDEDTKP